MILTFDLEAKVTLMFKHLTLTYNTNLAKVKANLHTEYQGHAKGNVHAVHRQT